MKKVSAIIFVLFVFVFFTASYKGAAPSRGKFKKLGEDVEDLTKPKVEQKVEDRFKGVLSDRHIKKWQGWWKGCATGFTLDDMEDIGEGPIYDEKITPLSSSQIGEGPAKMFYEKSPDGRRYLNPYYGRLEFKREGDGWQPYVQIRCGAALYDPKNNWARNILDCTALEGIDDAYWVNADRIVFMGYSSVTRQMNVECDSVQSCISPTIWVADLKAGVVAQKRGKLVKRSQCELGGYLKQRLPDFFGKEEK